MPIPILGISGGNYMVYMRVRGVKELNGSVKVIQDFWNKPIGVERHPSLVRQCPDPETEDADEDYLRQFIQEHNEAWAMSWGIEQGTTGLPVLDVGFELDDNEVTERLLNVLLGWKTNKDEGIQIFSQKAVAIFKNLPKDEVLKAVNELSIETIISLLPISAELPKNVRLACADRAWESLAKTHHALVDSKKKQKSLLEANDFLDSEMVKKNSTIEFLQQALNDDEKLIVDLSLKELMTELESRGYVEPKRRLCSLCQDSKEHTPYVGDVEQMNEPKNVEGLCPLVQDGQVCLQCTKSPPECFSNESLLICKAVLENPCSRMAQNLSHLSLVGKRKHTEEIHHLDKKTDGPLIKKLKRKYGTWILSEYESEDEKLDW